MNEAATLEQSLQNLFEIPLVRDTSNAYLYKSTIKKDEIINLK